jgi:hypothetical protein
MDRLLYIGCAPGSDVVLLQADLNAVRHHVGQGSAYEPLATDGIFGAKSYNRVSEFQRINHLAADGIAGPQTIGKLQELLISQPGLRVQQPGGGVSPGAAQGASDVSKPVPATKGGQNFGKMPPCDGSSGQAAKGGLGGFGYQGKGGVGGSSQQSNTGFGKIPSGRTVGGGGGKFA